MCYSLFILLVQFQNDSDSYIEFTPWDSDFSTCFWSTTTGLRINTLSKCKASGRSFYVTVKEVNPRIVNVEKCQGFTKDKMDEIMNCSVHMTSILEDIQGIEYAHKMKSKRRRADETSARVAPFLPLVKRLESIQQLTLTPALEQELAFIQGIPGWKGILVDIQKVQDWKEEIKAYDNRPDGPKAKLEAHYRECEVKKQKLMDKEEVVANESSPV